MIFKYFSLIVISLALALTISAMTDNENKDPDVRSKETAKGPGAVGGGQLEEVDTGEEDPFDAFQARFQTLSQRDRRRTIERLSAEFHLADASSHGHHHDDSDHIEPGHVAGPQSNIQTINVETNTTKRLRPFSGAKKPSNGETDYYHWRKGAIRIVKDREMTPAVKKRIVLQSLSGKAEATADLIQDKPVSEIVKILDSIWGSTSVGGDLLADFWQICQTEETASEYLNTLFIKISEVIAEEGLPMEDLSKTLLKQFLRGTTDEDLLSKLNLQEKVENPPDFPDLFSLVRRTEALRTQRALRHKSSKVARTQQATVESNDDQSEQAQLIKRVAKLEEELRMSYVSDDVTPASGANSTVVQLQQRVAQLERRNFKVRGFCYRCGEDGHFATDCENPPNKELVSKKRDARQKARLSKQGNC